MRRAAGVLCLMLWAGTWPVGAAEIAAIAYHDIVTKRNAGPYAITRDEFERQMAYLARAGYRPISLRLLDDARRGRATLPDKPVLLTFDDGLKSYYQYAYPVLRRYRYPSIVSVVTAWTDGRAVPENHSFMTWDELREVARSSEVEILSHTDDLHRGSPANPFGSLLPAAVTRIYDPASGVYETETQHARRVQADLKRSVERLRAELGRPPAGVAWPYGEFDAVLTSASKDLGMEYHLTLGIAPTRLAQLPRINRAVLKDYRGLSDFADALTHAAYRKQQLRFVEIDMDWFGGKDQAERERLLSRLLSRLQLLRVNAVIIRPFSADHKRAFFHNTLLPVETDLLSRLTQQLTRRTYIADVYLRLPAGGRSVPAALYADLARLNWFSGVVFDGPVEPAEFAAARRVFAHYKPSVQLGVNAETAVPGADFRLVALDADAAPETLARRAAAARVGDSRTLFLLRRSASTTERTLRSAMQTLRAAGVEHYGYSPDGVDNAPAALDIVGALNERTIAVGRR